MRVYKHGEHIQVYRAFSLIAINKEVQNHGKQQCRQPPDRNRTRAADTNAPGSVSIAFLEHPHSVPDQQLPMRTADGPTDASKASGPGGNYRPPYARCYPGLWNREAGSTAAEGLGHGPVEKYHQFSGLRAPVLQAIRAGPSPRTSCASPASHTGRPITAFWEQV